MKEKPFDSAGPFSIENQIAEVGRDLAASLNNVLTAIPGAPHRPQWLARSLGVNTVLTSRLLKAANHSDPIAVTHAMPGPEPLRRLLKAAARRKVSQDLIRTARLAVDRFEKLIEREAGDRSALDAIISGWLPDARERVELIAKQSVFRGMSQLLGSSCEVVHSTMINYPSETNRDRADQVSIMASLGLRRVRPGLVVTCDTIHTGAPLYTLTNQPVEGLRDVLLEQFCSRPLPQLQVNKHDNVAKYTLSGDDVGVRSAVDLVHATYLPAGKQILRDPSEPARPATLAIGLGTPARTLIFDIILHEDVFPGQTPELALYRTVGVFNVGSRRDIDRMDVIESVQFLGNGISRFRTAENPAYIDMLRHVCEQRGWDSSKLRCFRCRVEYPIYSVEVVVRFEMPPRPGARRETR
jgi:hypothetical protein